MFLKNKIEFFRQHKFVRDTAILQVGNVTGTLIQGIAGVILARLFQPELFGIYSLAFGLGATIVVFFSVISQDSVSAILANPYTSQDRERLTTALAFIIKILIITGIFAVSSFLFAPIISQSLYQNSTIGFYAAIFVLSLFLSNSFFAISRVIFQLVGKMWPMTILGAGDQLARSILAILFLIFGFGIFGAALGHLLGALIIAVASFVILYHANRIDHLFPRFEPLFKRVKNVKIREYFGISMWIAIDRNLAILYGTLAIAITGIFVTPSEIGFFKLAFAYVNIILSLLTPISTLSNVTFVRSKLLDNVHNLRNNFIKVSLYSMCLSSLLTFGAIIIAKPFFRVLYGVSYLPSVEYVLGFIAYGALFGIGVGLGPMWRAVNKVRTSIMINLITLGAGIPLGLLLVSRYGIWGAVIMVTIWFTASHVASFLYLVKKLKTI